MLAHGVLLEVVTVDMLRQRSGITESFKRHQAEGLLEHVTREHQASLVHELVAFRERMLTMPNQLFVQMILTVALVKRSFETFANYFAQRSPEELGGFTWTVDAKGDAPTTAERLWSSLILPMMHMEIFQQFGWADYSHLERFSVELPPHTAGGPKQTGYDLEAILRDQLAFKNSKEDRPLRVSQDAVGPMRIEGAMTIPLLGVFQIRGERISRDPLPCQD